MKLKVSIKLVWYGLIGLMTLLPMLIILPWIGSKTHSLLLENALLREAEFNKHVSDMIEHEVGRMITLLENKSDPMAFSVERSANKKYLDDSLDMVLKREPAISLLSILEPDGTVIANLTRHEADKRYAVGDKWTGTSRNPKLDGPTPELVISMAGRTYIGAPHLHDGKTNFHITVPIGPIEQPVAILMAKINADLLWQALEPKLNRQDVITYMVDRRGSLLTSPVGTKYRTGDMITQFDIIRSFLGSRDWKQDLVYQGLNGASVFGVVLHVDFVNWGVVSEIPEKTISGPIVKSLSTIGILILTIVTFFSGAGFWFVNRMLHPMTQLSDAFEGAAKGDYSPNITSNSIKEFDSMAAGFNHMIHEINLREKELRKYRQYLEKLVEERTAELTNVNKELKSFSYSVAHDLRSPLRSIDGFSLALLEDNNDQLDETGKDHLGRVRKASQHMGMLIDDLLSLSRMSRHEMRRETIELSLLAHDIIACLKESQPDRHIELKIEEGMIANGDAKLMRIVLDNLLGNAWKFTNKVAKPKIEFGTNKKDNVQVYFVRDNGVGFDMQYADKLFNAFQRLHRVGEFPGTGIGLATVQRIINRHGGRVWAESEVDKGATFYFNLS